MNPNKIVSSSWTMDRLAFFLYTWTSRCACWLVIILTYENASINVHPPICPHRQKIIIFLCACFTMGYLAVRSRGEGPKPVSSWIRLTEIVSDFKYQRKFFSILIECLNLNKKYLIRILNQIIITYLFLNTDKRVYYLMLCVIKITIYNWKYIYFRLLFK